MRNQATAKAARRNLMRQIRKATGLPLPVASLAASLLYTHLSYVWFELTENQSSETRAALASAVTWEFYQPGCDCCSGWNVPILNGPKGSFNYREV